MKKLFAILMTIIMTLSFTACSSSADNDGTFTIGLIQLMEHTSLDEIRTAFESEIKASMPDAKIVYENAQGEMSNITTICTKFVADDVDMIVAIATPAAQGAAVAIEGTDIPLVFSAVTDPVAAELVLDPNAPEGNITGTSDAVAVDEIFSLAKELTPNAKKFGLVYNLSESNSVSVIGDVKEYLDAQGLSYEEATVTTSADVKTASEALIGKGIDGFFSPTDNTVASAMSAFASVAIDNKLPIYVAADSMVIDGGLATVGVNYTNLGKQTAQMATKILSGTAVKDIPVEVLSEYSVTVNEETASAIGVDVSNYTK